MDMLPRLLQNIWQICEVGDGKRKKGDRRMGEGVTGRDDLRKSAGSAGDFSFFSADPADHRRIYFIQKA